MPALERFKPLQFSASVLVCVLLAWPSQAASSDIEFSREAVLYRYRPLVFADQKLQVGLSGTVQTLTGMLWYIRMDESTRALFGMESLSRLVQDDQIPGLDFSGHRTLVDADLERLFGQDLWMSGSSGYKFRLIKLAGTSTSDRVMIPRWGQTWIHEYIWTTQVHGKTFNYSGLTPRNRPQGTSKGLSIASGFVEGRQVFVGITGFHSFPIS
jgi:hypothetical protein